MKIINETTDIFLEAEFDSEDVLFFDIETTGLKKEYAQVYLVGCAFKDGNSWIIRQYLAENALDERDVVESFYSFARGFKTLVHFNGNRFDVPFMDYKAELYEIDFRLSYLNNFDIYLAAKPLRGILSMEGMGQKAIESFLKVGRDDEMGGGELIAYYYDYERTGDFELEKFLLLHNHDDVKGMFPLLKILDYLNILNGKFTFESFEEVKGTAIFNFRLPKHVCTPFENEKWNMCLAADGNLLQLNVKIYEGEAYYPLEDYKNYYYLTEENQVIHKDVAAFVDKSRKRKATKAECCVKKTGRFLQLGLNSSCQAFCEVVNQINFGNDCVSQKEGIKIFYVDLEKKWAYFEFTEDITESEKLIKAYAVLLIKNIFAKDNKKFGSGKKNIFAKDNKNFDSGKKNSFL